MDCAVLDFITKILWDICGTSSNRAVSSSLSVCCLFWWKMRFWFTFCAMGGPHWGAGAKFCEMVGRGDLSGWSTTNYHNGEYFSHNAKDAITALVVSFNIMIINSLETQNWVPSISENYILRSKVHKFTPNGAKGSIFCVNSEFSTNHVDKYQVFGDSG